MKNEIKKILKENISIIVPTIIAFLIIFVVYRVSKMTMDGWASKLSYPSTGGILGFLKCLIDLYKTCNGRIVSNLICGVLESFTSEIPLDFFNAAMIIFIFIFTWMLCHGKNKNDKSKYAFALFVFLALVLLINPSMRIEVLFYANTAYVVPIPLALLYCILLKKVLKNDIKKENNIIFYMSLIGISIGMWMEHIAMGFACVISLITLYLFYKKNSKKWKVLIPNVTTIISFVIMMSSPGLRAHRTIISENPVLTIIVKNFKIIYVDIISQNLYLIILLLGLVISIIMSKKVKKVLDYLFVILTGGMLFVFLIAVLYRTYAIENFEFINIVLPVNAYLFKAIPLVIMFVILALILLYGILNIKNKQVAFYILGIGIFSLAPLLISPNTGARISSIGFFALSILAVIFLFEIDKNKFVKIIGILIIVLSFDQAVIYLRRINDVNKKIDRITYNIKRMQEDNTYNYQCFNFVPYYYKEDAIFNSTLLQNAVHYKAFLDAFDLNEHTRIIFANKNVYAVKNICIEKNKIVFHNDVEYKDILYFKIHYYSINKENDESEIIETDLLNGDYSIKLKCGYYVVDVFYKKSDETFGLISDRYEFVI